MTLKELESMCVIGDEVCLYECTSVDDACYKDLYQGRLRDAPEELLQKDIVVIGAQDKYLIGIEISLSDKGGSKEGQG